MHIQIDDLIGDNEKRKILQENGKIFSKKNCRVEKAVNSLKEIILGNG